VKLLLVAPILIPLLTAGVTVAFWRAARFRAWCGVVGAAALLAAGGLLLAATAGGQVRTVQIGNWPAPFGITLAVDLFSALMVLITGIIGLMVAVYSLADVDIPRQRYGYFPLFHILLAGVCGAFITGDIFNLYVWFEVMLMASFLLLALGSERAQLEGAFKYVTINLISSMVFLTGVGILYGTVHTLNLADLALRVPEMMDRHGHLVRACAMLFGVCFGLKAAVFPLFFWLPASYATPPAAVSAVFAGLLTKVGVYALIRVFTLVFGSITGIYALILVVAGLTMLVGVLGAVAQFEMRRILSFHIISQIGYMIMGLGLLVSSDPGVRTLGLTAGIFYIIHHIIVKTNLFLVSGTVRQLGGTYDLRSLGGLVRAPLLSALFLIPALSLAGIPPLSGFWAKLGLIEAGFLGGQNTIVIVALLTSLLTLVSMMKIWNEVFWKPAPQDAPEPAEPMAPGQWAARFIPIALLAGLTVLIGLFPAPLLTLAGRAADRLLNPAAYISAVNLHEAADAGLSTTQISEDKP